MEPRRTRSYTENGRIQNEEITQSQTLQHETSSLSSLRSPGEVYSQTAVTPQESAIMQEEEVNSQVSEFDREVMQMDEAELDRRIAAARTEQRMQKKRSYLDSIRRGEEPDINPIEFDDPIAPVEIHPTRRPRHEGLAHMKLQPLRFRGGSYASLQNFLFELESRFLTYNEDIHDDSERVVYAGSSLDGPIKTRWTKHVSLQYKGDLGTISWAEMKQWLEESVSDADTRCLETVSKLRRINQREDQSFTQFLDAYEEIESELSLELAPKFRACSVIDALRPDLKKQILSTGIPTTRAELVTAGRRGESLLRNAQPWGGRSWQGARNQRPLGSVSDQPSQSSVKSTPPPTQAPHEAEPRSAAASNTVRATCYKCGQQGHYANACPQLKCNRCGGSGHYARNCNVPVSGANATPQVRHVAPGP
jgi:hypothetical protein